MSEFSPPLVDWFILTCKKAKKAPAETPKDSKKAEDPNTKPVKPESEAQSEEKSAAAVDSADKNSEESEAKKSSEGGKASGGADKSNKESGGNESGEEGGEAGGSGGDEESGSE